MTPEERETHIHYDHPDGIVRIFTTQVDVYKNFIKRLGKKNLLINDADEEKSIYEIHVQEKFMRKPYYVSPVTKK